MQSVKTAASRAVYDCLHAKKAPTVFLAFGTPALIEIFGQKHDGIRLFHLNQQTDFASGIISRGFVQLAFSG